MTTNNSIWLTALLGCLLLSGCPNNGAGETGTTVAAAEDEHAGHDHSAPAEPQPVADEHAGHDHDADAEHAEDEHAGHDHDAETEPAEDEHAGHDHAAEEPAGISLSIGQINELGITSAPAGAGSLGRELEMTGEIGINEDEITHVIPRIPGIVRQVHYRLGDHVAAGAVMLSIDSMELAQIKSNYLAVLSQLELLKQTLDREQMLVEKGISAEQDYLAANQAYEEKQIERRGLEQQLRALGVSAAQITAITADPQAPLTGYVVQAPTGGEIIEKHVAIGEMVDNATPLFTISNMSTVWVRLNIYQQDMADVREGMVVLIDPGHGIDSATGVIDYIEPLVGEATRTAVARVVLERTSQALRPGLFVTGYVEIDGEQVDILVPRDSVIELDEDMLVFVRHGTSFEPRVVLIGQRTASGIEILSGIEAGEEIVVSGAFQLKAELLKGTFDPHAGHAH